jgi:hypothetical protein
MKGLNQGIHLPLILLKDAVSFVQCIYKGFDDFSYSSLNYECQTPGAEKKALAICVHVKQ